MVTERCGNHLTRCDSVTVNSKIHNKIKKKLKSSKAYERMVTLFYFVIVLFAKHVNSSKYQG